MRTLFVKLWLKTLRFVSCREVPFCSWYFDIQGQVMVRAVLFCACTCAHPVLCYSESGRCFVFLGIRWRLHEGILANAGEWGWQSVHTSGRV
jgi:hypothetical protein